MIDLTPLDVRKKRGDFGKVLRGYDAQEVDTFLDLVAERMEELVKETLAQREHLERLQSQVDVLSGRERAIQEALVTAQSLRDDIREQTRRETELARREADVEVQRILADAERQGDERRAAVHELERKRTRFLRAFRALLERELDLVAVEEGRSPLNEAPMELDLSGGGRPPRETTAGYVPPRGGAEPAGSAAPGELWLSGLPDDPPAAHEEAEGKELSG